MGFFLLVSSFLNCLLSPGNGAVISVINVGNIMQVKIPILRGL